jgi:transposase
MSLPQEKVQRTLFDVPVLVGDLFDKKDRYRLFRERILPALYAKREQLAELYCQVNGRPAIEPVLALGVTLLQFMEKAPDRKALENVRLHLGWKYALDLELDATGFHPTSLVRFRQRLLEGGAERIGFDALFDGLRAAGLVRKQSKQRLDSTHVLGAVSKMGRLEVVRETIRLFLVMVEHRGGRANLPGDVDWEERYIDGDIQWHRVSQDTLIQKFKQAGADARRLIKWARREASPIRDHDHALLLQRVFLEQYELSQEGVGQRKHEGSGFVKNPHDPDVQWAAKDLAKTKQWEGYKIQICETVDEDGNTKEKGEPTEQFLTEVTTTEAIASDLAGRRRVEETQQANGQFPAPELYVDAGYITDDTLAEAREAGRTLIGPARPPGNPGNKKRFTSNDFNVCIAKREALCPAGKRQHKCARLNNPRTGQVDYRFDWTSECEGCPLRKRCTTGKNSRRLVVGEYHDDLQKRRREMETETFQKLMTRRNGIEGTVSEFTRLGGRRTRYRSKAKTTLANYFMGAAVNANRWIRLEQWDIEQQEKEA